VVECISALNYKSEPGTWQLPVIECLPALNDKIEPGPRWLPVVEGTLALSNKSVPGTWRLIVVEGTSALNDTSEPGPRQLPVVELRPPRLFVSLLAVTFKGLRPKQRAFTESYVAMHAGVAGGLCAKRPRRGPAWQVYKVRKL
jgi:hypothetical protein